MVENPLRTPRWARKIIDFRRMVLFALPVGVLSGLGVAALELTCNALLWNHLGSEQIAVRLAWPVVGLLLSGYVLHKLHVRTVGMLNEVVVHYHTPPIALSVRDDAMKLGACVATVGLGASAGLGGPSQWIGARIGLYYVRTLTRIRALRGVHPTHALLVGAAAGVSAIFRAPLAGTLLALETPFSRDMDGTALVPASLAALTAHVVHGLLVDSAPLLPFPAVCPSGLHAALSAVVIGVAAGFLSRRFQRVLTWTRLSTGHLRWWQRSLGGGLVTSATGLIAWYYFGETWTFQAGLPLAHALFSARFLGWAALALLCLKLVSIWATFGTSGVAGLLVITLTMGTLLGASCQPLLAGLDPQTACAIGVCTYLAANYNAPLTAIALAAEWGGTSLLSLTWAPILVAAWIGEGLANTPAKTGRRHGRAIHHH